MKVLYKTLYQKYKDDIVRLKAVQYAHWTIPKLMPDTDLKQKYQQEQLERDYQEIGALLVNNLASKLATLLFPHNRPFFKAELSKEAKQRADKTGKLKEIVASLASIEKDASGQLFVNAGYSQVILALQHLIVTGNCLTYRDSENKKFVAYGLQQFAVRRDSLGTAMDTILREYRSFDSLPLELQAELNPAPYGKYKPEQSVEVFTRIQRVQVQSGWVYEVSQQVEGKDVGTKGSYPEHLCPWRTVVWSVVPGEHYGRGLVEDYAGGFAKLSDLSEAAALYAIEALRVINLVEPGSGTDVDEVAEAETGEYVQGAAGSITAYETGASNKLRDADARIESTEQRLARAFMYSANVRNAERVTAYELRQQAQEAETTLGGAYSVLAEQLQVPLAHILVNEIKPDLLQGIVTDTVKLDVIAGLPALGRATDVQSLVSVATDASAIVPALMQLDKRISTEKVMDVILQGYSVDPETVMKDEDQLDAENSADAALASAQVGAAQAVSMADQQAALSQLQQG